MWKRLCHVLLVVLLMLNGIGSAMAGVAMQAGKMHPPAAANASPSTQNHVPSGHAHHDMHGKTPATEPSSKSDAHAPLAAHQDKSHASHDGHDTHSKDCGGDCCKGKTDCGCPCMHATQAAMSPAMPSGAAPPCKAMCAAASKDAPKPPLGEKIRPPIQ